MNSESGEANKHEKPDDGANKVTPSQSNTPSITNVPSGNTKTEAANQTEWERRHYWVQVAVFIVGVIVAIIYSCQLSEMRKATHAAKRAGDLARQGMEQVERNARLDQRAWIGISGIKGKPEATKPFNVVIAMTNSGKTPAKRVDMFAVGESTFVWEVEDFATQLQTQAKDRKISNALLPPNGTASNTLKTVGGGTWVSDTDVKDFQTGKRTFIIYGQVTYQDIFTQLHWLTCCAYLTYGGDEAPENQWSWKYCEENNDTGDGDPPVRY